MGGVDDLNLLAVLIGAALPGFIAIGLTMYTIRQARRQQRLEAFTRMQDLLTAQESQRGRRRLYAAVESGVWPERDSDEWDEINRAVSQLDTLGMYLRLKIVSRDLVLEGWHHSLRRLKGPAEHFLFLRGDVRQWPHLRILFREADGYRSRLHCCSPTLGDHESRGASSEPGDELSV